MLGRGQGTFANSVATIQTWPDHLSGRDTERGAVAGLPVEQGVEGGYPGESVAVASTLGPGSWEPSG